MSADARRQQYRRPSTADIMAMNNRLAGTMLLAAVAFTITACGPIRLDGRPQIRGRLVGVDVSSVAITHKTGRTYRVEVTPDTTIVNATRRDGVRLCAGQRATVYLVDARRFTASSITLWDARCQ